MQCVTLTAKGMHMSYVLTLVFEGVGEDQYWAVNDTLGMAGDWSQNWPAGMVDHSAGPTPNGWMVVERWESKAAHETFMATRLGPALTKVSVRPPVHVFETVSINDKSRSAANA